MVARPRGYRSRPRHRRPGSLPVGEGSVDSSPGAGPAPGPSPARRTGRPPRLSVEEVALRNQRMTRLAESPPLVRRNETCHCCGSATPHLLPLSFHPPGTEVPYLWSDFNFERVSPLVAMGLAGPPPPDTTVYMPEDDPMFDLPVISAFATPRESNSTLALRAFQAAREPDFEAEDPMLAIGSTVAELRPSPQLGFAPARRRRPRRSNRHRSNAPVPTSGTDSPIPPGTSQGPTTDPPQEVEEMTLPATEEEVVPVSLSSPTQPLSIVGDSTGSVRHGSHLNCEPEDGSYEPTESSSSRVPFRDTSSHFNDPPDRSDDEDDPLESWSRRLGWWTTGFAQRLKHYNSLLKQSASRWAMNPPQAKCLSKTKY